MKKFEQAPVNDPVQTENTLHQNWERWFNLLTNNVVQLVQYDQSLDVSSVAANNTSEQTFTVTGVQANDVVLTVNKPSHTAGLGVVNYRVSAADTIAITFMNTTGSPIDPGAEVYTIIVVRG